MAFCIIFFGDLIHYNKNFDKMLPEKVSIDYYKMKYKSNSKFLLRQQTACNISAQQLNNKHHHRFAAAEH